MKRWIILFIILLAGCAKQESEFSTGLSFAETITGDVATGGSIALLTEDGKTIFGTYMAPRVEGSPSVVLLHMLGWDRRGFKSFANELNYEGYGVISIDLRGHGESLVDGRNWHSFDDADFNDMVYDVKAAVDYLKKDTRYIDPARITLIGTSLGANLAAKYSQMDDINGLVLISPGIEYKGVNIQDALENYTGRLLIVAGTKDEYSYKSSLDLYSSANKATDKELKTYITDAHGIHLLDRTDLKGVIFDFLESV